MTRPRARTLALLLAGAVAAPALAVALAVLLAPRRLVRAAAALRPGCAYMADTAERVVALTIDDAPDPRTTPRLLELLARHRARATFFVIAERARGHEALLGRMVAGGHELGNHLTRDEPSIRLSPAAFEAALVETDRVLRPYGAPRWARPGAGWYDRRMVETMARHGYRCVLGSVYPFDPLVRSAGFARRYILRHAHPGGIIILHDGGTRGARTAEALAAVLPALARRGYRVVTLSELMGPPAGGGS